MSLCYRNIEHFNILSLIFITNKTENTIYVLQKIIRYIMAATKEKITMDEKDNIALYFADAKRESLLTREEEIEITKRIKNGDIEARTKLINSNLRFVITIAKQYQNSGLSLEDLVSEGNIGLITAVDRFEVDKGYHFISYAVYWIRQSILRAINEKSRLIRLPLNKAVDLIEVERAVHKLYYKSGKMPDLNELSGYLKRDRSEVSNILSMSVEHLSIEGNTMFDGSTESFADILEDKQNKSVEDELIDKELKKELIAAMEDLSEMDKDIITARYGLVGDKKTLKEVGEIYNLTKERIRQIEKKALKKMYLNRRSSLKDFITS